MWDWITGVVSGIGRAIGIGTGDLGPLPSLPRQTVWFPRFPAQDPADDPDGPTIDQILQERRFRTVEPVQTGITFEGDTFEIGEASFEPDTLDIPPDQGTATDIPPEIENQEEDEEVMPIGIIPILAGAGAGIASGVGFAAGAEVFDAFTGALLGTTDAGGTSTGVPAPATTAGAGVTGGNGTAGSLSCGCGSSRPSIAKTRAGILKGIGAQHGRCSFSYNVARRILRDLGEERGAHCLGITKEAACFLLIHPPKRRGRQITPKQINRAMGAYKRVRALNKSVRKTLGPGCKL